MDNGPEAGGDWADFAKRLRRLYGDAIRLTAARGQLTADTYDLRHAKLQSRILDLALAEGANPHARRLAKRLAKYGE